MLIFDNIFKKDALEFKKKYYSVFYGIKKSH